MKKFLIATGVAVFALASVAGAQGYTFNTNLTVGSTGADVVALQTALMSAGINIPSIASGAAAKGYFGSQTQAAVKAYQTSKGIPSTGFVGPLTRAALNGSATTGGSTVVTCPVGFTCTPVGGTSSTPTTLAGTDGTIDSYDLLSQYSNEEVGDGESDVKVYGMEADVSNDGDVALKSVKVQFDYQGSNSTRISDYVDSVTVWNGTSKIGSADASSFTKVSSGKYTKTIALSGNTVLKADATSKIYITVDAVSNIDSGDIESGSEWDLDVTSVRYEDGSGVTTTEDPGLSAVGIDFVDFATAADTELKLSTDNSSPDATIVVVDEDKDTNNVPLLIGKIKLEGTSDVTLNELPVKFTTSATSSLAAVVNSVTLKIDGEEFTKTVSTTTNTVDTVVFDDLDINIDAGSTVTFTVYADINDINASGVQATSFVEGNALKADISSTERNNIDAENAEGDQLDDSSEKSGTVVGEYMEFRTQGIGLTLVSTKTSVLSGDSANDDVGTFEIKFKVTAFGEDAYVAQTATTSYLITVDKAGTVVSQASTSATVSTDADESDSNDNYVVRDGQSEDITLTVTVPMGTLTSGQYRVSLAGVDWNNDDSTTYETYSSDLTSFKTGYLFLN